MQNESGRSMVEMLGVLAIIGVLSIGGIAGYTMAMNRYKANEVVNAMALASITAMTADGGNGHNMTGASPYDYETMTGSKYPNTSVTENITSSDKGVSVTTTFKAGNQKICNLVSDIIGSIRTKTKSCSDTSSDQVTIYYS